MESRALDARSKVEALEDWDTAHPLQAVRMLNRPVGAKTLCGGKGGHCRRYVLQRNYSHATRI